MNRTEIRAMATLPAPRVDAAAVRDKIRLQKLRARVFAHEVFVETLLIRVRELIRTGKLDELLALEQLLSIAVMCGPTELPEGTDMTTTEDDALFEKARRYRVFVEEIATFDIEKPEEIAYARARARTVLGWPTP